jgi:hypothetical protein
VRCLALALVLLTACGGGAATRFNELPQGPATAPASAPAVPEIGGSDLRARGEVTLRTTRDMQCSYAVDDFFVRGRIEDYQGVPMYLSVNVEFYKKPGRYVRRTQVLLRRIGLDSEFYASWYAPDATATILPHGGGADIEEVVLEPEAGTHSTRPVRLAGHVACLGTPRPGPG